MSLEASMGTSGKKHRYLSLEKISAGMVLADDLLDRQGHVLLPAGISLTENMLKSLAHHEVHQVCILVDVQEDISAPSQQEKLARLEQLFRMTPRSAATDSLYTYLKNYREQEMI
jgi:hypothetical protein